MTFNWRMTAIAAAGCFLLSFVTGLFAQVNFGWLLLRALLMGLLGGGLAIGLRWLLLRFLPELSQSIGGEEPARAVDTGRNVDIVVADESGDGGVAETQGEKPPSAPVAVEAEDGEGGDFEEELEELKTSPILTEKGEETEETYKPVKPPEVIEDVDVLPDLEVFTDSFAAPAMEGEGGPEGQPETRPSSAGSGSRGSSPSDAETIAQAIRTALHRDKKG